MSSDSKLAPSVAAAGGVPVPSGGTDTTKGFSVARRRLMLGLLALIYSLNYLDRQIVVILQEPIKADFGLADWQLGMITGGAFGLFYTSMGIPIAQRIDRGVNRIRLIAIFTAVWSLMTALCGVTRNFGQFFIARMGVGLAEAGFAPAAHSLLSDMYSARERPQAMGIFAIGVPVGIMAGLSIGGIIAQMAGWRTALLVAGIPGLFAALLLPILARDPVRGAMEEPGPAADPAALPPQGFLAGARLLMRRRAFVHVVLGTAATAFVQAGVGAWMPSFLIRVHGMSLSQAGLSFGILSGVCGLIGTIAGGWQATRMADRGLHAMLWIPMLGLLLTIPLYVIALLAGSGQAALALLILPMLLSPLWTAPSIALVQSLSPVAMRARASALYIVASNLIGVSMGPLVLGVLSDLFAALHGGDAVRGLREALIVVAALGCWGIIHWALAVRALLQEKREAAA